MITVGYNSKCEHRPQDIGITVNAVHKGTGPARDENSKTVVHTHLLDLVMLLHVFPQFRQLRVLGWTLATRVRAGTFVLLTMLIHVTIKLTLNAELIAALGTNQVLFLFMQHDVGLEAGHAGKLLATLRANGVTVFAHVSGQMKAEVVLHIE